MKQTIYLTDNYYKKMLKINTKTTLIVWMILQCGYSSQKQQNGTLNQTKTFKVKRGEEQQFSFFATEGDFGANLWKIQFDVQQNSSSSLYVSIRQAEQVKSFRLPQSFPGTRIKTTRRTVDFCPFDVDENSTLSIAISTYSQEEIPVDINVSISNLNQWQGGNQNKVDNGTWSTEDTLKLGEPVVKFVPRLPRGDVAGLDDLWRLEVAASNDSDCMCSVVSIQNATCPYYDRIESAKRYGQWQTMLNRSSMIIDSYDYPNGFLIVVVANADDKFCNIVQDKHRCLNKTSNLLLQKLTLTVKRNSSRNDYIIGTLVIVGFYLLLLIVSLTISCLRFTYDVKSFKDLRELSNVIHEKMGKPLDKTKASVTMDNFISDDVDSGGEKVCKIQKVSSMSIEPQDLTLTGTDCLDGLGYRLNRTLYVSQLSQKLNDPKKSKAIYQKNKLYAGNVLLMSVFYCVPIIQIVANSNGQIDLTGNHDLCYFNHLCQKPLGHLKDFSHVFSNIGYIMLGMLFIGIVALKEFRHLRLSKNCQENFGLPQQFGLFYAMGMALMMEGILSSCYHVCPTVIAFQYDTTYMYLMFMLIFLRFFQSRHPDITCNATKAYFGLGVALILEAISIYYSGPIFWTIFCICYIIFIVIITTHAYHLGVIRMDQWIFWNVIKLIYAEFKKVWQSVSCKGEQKIKMPKIRPRLIFLGLISSLNIAICLYFALNNAKYASNYLLGIFACNMSVYLFYYITMKSINKECPTWEAWFYLVCVVMMGIPAMKLFKAIEKTTDVSPAESRSLNRDCQLLDFYDGHDIWHFLGGAAVFFGFMFLLTVDENLKYTRRDIITVF